LEKLLKAKANPNTQNLELKMPLNPLQAAERHEAKQVGVLQWVML